MKKSKNISLVLITAALASCDKQTANPNDGEIPDDGNNNVYMRSDTTEDYVNVNTYNVYGNIWYYAFRPYYGYYNGGYYGYYNFPYRQHHWGYNHAGYYNNHYGNSGNGHYYGPRTTTGGFGHRSSSSIAS